MKKGQFLSKLRARRVRRPDASRSSWLLETLEGRLLLSHAELKPFRGRKELPRDLGTTVVYRVNAGGPALEAPDGAWAADTAQAPSPYSNAAAALSSPATMAPVEDLRDPSIPPGTPPALFFGARADAPGGAEMSWAFPVEPGLHEVRLYYAENALREAGARVFDVAIEGETVLDDFDIFAAAGGDGAAVVASFDVDSDATLDIDFVRQVGDPMVSGIEIRRIDPIPNQLGISDEDKPHKVKKPKKSDPVDFGSVAVGEQKKVKLKLTNLSDQDIDIETVSFKGPGADQFSHSFDDKKPKKLKPGKSEKIEVTFTPTAAGSKEADLIVGQAAGEPTTFQMAAVADPPSFGFGKSTLSGASSGSATSLQFGPDGRLYVAQQNGVIKAYSVVRNGANSYAVTATETINLIRDMPNRNDDGLLNPSVVDRQVTGILVTGSAASPVIYVGSSDPRIGGGGAGTDTNLDTNSGILSRLTRSGSSWTKLDLVRGLPRSEENHSSNGMALDPATNTLYVAVGGLTNQGAPSHNFTLLPEYALSAAILSINLNAIGNTTYDLPTLDDEGRPGTNDANDPFGGNNGKNQARLVPGGPVQVHSSGYRNAFDVVIAKSGRMYTIDNGSNAGWGDVPVDAQGNRTTAATAGNATNRVNEPGATTPDNLHLVQGPGYYAGHPNPTRANLNNKFNGSNPQSPVASANAVEGYFRAIGTEDGSLATFGASTNGLAEYTAANFGGSMAGDLLAASFDNTIYRIKLNAAGDAVASKTALFSNVGGVPLDLTTGVGALAGTIWVADYHNGIVVFEPNDFSGQAPTNTGAYDPKLDEDNDGYNNADEIDNGTSPGSGADVPPDWDRDFTSDRNDPNDDNDTLLDAVDPFAIDASNGKATALATRYSWDNDAPSPGGLLGLGFTGLMGDGTTNYAALHDPSKTTAGGAAGVFTIDEATAGTARANTQRYGYQFGFNATSSSPPFFAHTRVGAPFAGVARQAGQQIGLFFGTGHQDHYAALVIDGDGTVKLVKETSGNGSYTVVASAALGVASPSAVDLYLRCDPSTGAVQAFFTTTSGGVTGPKTAVGTSTTVPTSWFTAATAPAVGVMTTTGGGATFAATYDSIEVGYAWATGASMPAALGEVAGGIINGKMYLVGEGNSATYAYDLATDTWSGALAARPFVGHHHAAEVVNGKLYLFGGLHGSSDGKVQIYDPATNTWTTGAPMPFAAGSSSSALIHGQVYVAGGIIGTATTNQAARYDPATNTWTTLAAMKQGRNHAAAATDGSKLYVFGGRGPGSGDGNSVADGFDTVQVYDPATNAWTSSLDAGSTRAPLPQKRGGTGKAVYYNNEFYVLGGETSTGGGATASGVYDRVDIYNAVTNKWRLGVPMPTARHGIFPLLAATAQAGTRIYVAGGGTQAGASASAILETYLLPPTPGILSAPSNLAAAAASSTQVNLTWADNATNETNYAVERKTGSGAYAVLANAGALAANTTGYADATAAAATQYTYRVRATNAAGASAYSNEATVITPAVGSQAVASLTLINADTDQPIAGYEALANGATLNLATLPTRNLSLRANTVPAAVGSVKFAYDGNADYSTESTAPYALAGDVNGNYNPWTPAPGAHSLTATPYSGAGATGTAGTALTITFTVTDNASALPAVSIGDAAVAEGNSGAATASFAVTLSAASSQPVTVAYATANGTAAAPGDYAATSGTLTFAAGETSKAIVVAVAGDTIDEPNETFVVNLSAPTNATLGDAQGQGTITDDDPAAGQAPFGGSPAAVPATIQAEDFDTGGEGVAYHDTDAVNNGGAYRPADAVDLEATTDAGLGHNVGWVAAGEWLEYTVSVPTAGTYTLEARVASAGAGGAFHVEFNTVDKTGPVAVPNTGGWQTWQTVQKGGLSLAAGTQVMRVAFDTAGAATGFVGNLNWFKLTGSAAALPTVSIGDVAVAEGKAGTVTASFAVTLSAASSQPVTVAYATANGTAAAPGDYAATSGTLTFAAGETSKAIVVAVAGDTIDEPNETFVVNLSAPTNATLGDAQGQGTITDDDPAAGPLQASYASSPPTTWTVGQAQTYAVTLTNTGTQAWNAGGANFVRLGVYFGGASDAAGAWPSEPTRFALPHDVAPGASVTLDVTVAAPAAAGGYVLRHRLVKEGVAWFADQLKTDVTVAAAAALPTVSIGDVAVAEGNGGTVTASFAVTLSAASSQPVTVAYATANGTAAAPGDYAATSGTLTFAAGETSKAIVVAVAGDTIDEPNETFVVNLSAPTNATLGDAQGQGTITDDDPAAGPLQASYASSPPTTWTVGQAQTYAVTLTNTGTQAWNAGGANFVRLGVYFGGASDAAGAWPSEPTRFALPHDVAPGASVTVTVTVAAPAAAGGYVLRHRLVKEGVAWFADQLKTDVTVAAAAAAALFSDNFAAASLGAAWSTDGGTWEQSGGLLRQTSLAAGDPKKAAVTGVAFPADSEVRARVRVDTWAAGSDAARAGVSLGVDAAGLGYNLVFHRDTNTVEFLHDHVAWGNKYAFAWQVGIWYRFALRQEGGVLLGKVWADNQAEPAGWMFRQEGWAPRAGAPGLNGGSHAGATASFDEFTVTAASS